MADEITKTIKAIRTNAGDLQIAWAALADAPKPQSDFNNAKSGEFADALAVKNQINNINSRITEIQGGDALAGITINGKPLKNNPVLTANDVQAAEKIHKHDATDITSGVLPIGRGGTNSDNGSTGLKNLLAAGPMILSSGKQYGTLHEFEVLKTQTAVDGQIFFVKVQSEG